MRSVIVRIEESRVEDELIDLVKFRPEALGWHFRYPQPNSLRRSQTYASQVPISRCLRQKVDGYFRARARSLTKTRESIRLSLCGRRARGARRCFNGRADPLLLQPQNSV